MKVLLTGGAGFIGHHLVEHLLKETDWSLVLLDKLDHAGNLNRVAEVLAAGPISWIHRVRTVYHDLRAPISVITSHLIGKIDLVLHLAAASDVDRSIADPLSFVYDNVIGTTNLLEWCRGVDRLSRVLVFSTDEVFGPAPEGVQYHEWDRYNANNPYSGSKCGAEQMALAYRSAYGLPIFVTRTMNNIGERQHVSKYVPKVIRKIRDGEEVLIHADPTCTMPGSRFYIHCRNVSACVLFILGLRTGHYVFHIVGEREVDNRELAQLIAGMMRKPLKYRLIDAHSSRKGHDLRYALDGSLLTQLGWKMPVNFENSLERVVKWTLAHPHWLEGYEKETYKT